MDDTDDGVVVGPPHQSSWAGRVIAVAVFFGVIIAIVSIAFMPEKTADFEDTVRIQPAHVLTVRLVGERGMLEVLNDGPHALLVSSPVEGAPLTGTMELLPGHYIRRDIRGVGAIEVANASETTVTVRWRGGGPEPIHVAADPPKAVGTAGR